MLEEKIKSALKDIRPTLQADGGDVELVSVAPDGTVLVRLTGSCGCCPHAQMTLKNAIEGYLKQKIPEVKEVIGIE